MNRLKLCVLLVSLVVSLPVAAHSSEGVAGGLLSGFLHPLLGPDHLLAMLAVGLWGTFLPWPAIWVLPVVFPVVMAFGGVLGVLGLPMPGVELGIAGSAIALGMAVALKLKPPLAVVAILVAGFAIFHGHAHGTELPEAANPVAYSLGFVVATGGLHALGIALGALARWPWGEKVVRGAGALISLAGLYFLVRALA